MVYTIHISDDSGSICEDKETLAEARDDMQQWGTDYRVQISRTQDRLVVVTNHHIPGIGNHYEPGQPIVAR